MAPVVHGTIDDRKFFTYYIYIYACVCSTGFICVYISCTEHVIVHAFVGA